MSLAQFQAFLETEEAKEQLVKSAREAGFEVSVEDLDAVSGGIRGRDEGEGMRHSRDVPDGWWRKEKPEGATIARDEPGVVIGKERD